MVNTGKEAISIIATNWDVFIVIQQLEDPLRPLREKAGPILARRKWRLMIIEYLKRRLNNKSYRIAAIEKSVDKGRRIIFSQ